MRPFVPTIILVLAVVLARGPAAVAAPPATPLGDTIRQALDAQGPIVTTADHEMINAKCGLPAGTRSRRNLSFDADGLQCPDGRTINDAETRAMGDRIGKRAHAYADAALSRPEVKRAIERYTSDTTQATLRRLREKGVLTK